MRYEVDEELEDEPSTLPSDETYLREKNYLKIISLVTDLP